MSVVASRPDSATLPYAIPQGAGMPNYYADSSLRGSVQSFPSRTSSMSSFKTSYSASTAGSVSPESPCSSYRPFDSFASLEKFPSEPICKRIPQEVYDGILDQLYCLHCGQHRNGCVTCFQRDLHALSLTCRSWEKAVRAKLYNRIHIVGNDSPAQLKKYRLKRGSRLKLLRRTLRERKLLANLVFELRVPQMDLLFTASKHSAQWEEYRDLVASVVMVCPNLERLLGLTIPYNHEFDRLTHALSTRKKLKEHTWILGEATEISEASPRNTSCPGSLGPLQMFEFLDYHESWTNLETLTLYALDDKSALEPSIFLRMFNALPSLRNLCVSSFKSDAFGDSTLLCLPPLESLRLEKLPGVTDSGLAQYTSRNESHSLRSLALIEQNIGSLLVLSKVLASLRRLERLKIVQTGKCPTLPSEGMIFQPILASSSLRYLHWDVAGPDPRTALSKLDDAPFAKPAQHADTPNSHLARSILSTGFPNLESLRAPSDIEPPGALQAVCQPIPNGQALLHQDRYSLPRSSHGSVNPRPMALPGGNNLTSARIRAQTFIDMAAKDTDNGLRVVITDHSDSYIPDNALDSISDDDSDPEMDPFGTWSPPEAKRKPDSSPTEDPETPVTVYDFRMPAYMGQAGVRSKPGDASIPHFNLFPDIPGQEADGGLVGWKHILTANQSLTYAAGIGVNCFANNKGGAGAGTTSNPSPAPDEPTPLSPISTSTPSRFGWGSLKSGSMMSLNSVASAAPPSPITPTTNPPAALPWQRDTCTGSWNYSHKGGRDWWFHMERDLPKQTETVELTQLF